MREISPDRLGPWIALLRIFFGVVFLTNGIAKFVPGIAHTPLGYLIDSGGARSILTYDAHHNQVALYRALVDNVFLKYWGLFGTLQGLGEVAVGLMLVLGLAASLGALIALLLTLHIQFAALFTGPWLYEYAVEWVPLLCLVFLHPGRWFGLDAALVRRGGRWARFL